MANWRSLDMAAICTSSHWVKQFSAQSRSWHSSPRSISMPPSSKPARHAIHWPKRSLAREWSLVGRLNQNRRKAVAWKATGMSLACHWKAWSKSCQLCLWRYMKIPHRGHWYATDPGHWYATGHSTSWMKNANQTNLLALGIAIAWGRRHARASLGSDLYVSQVAGISRVDYLLSYAGEGLKGYVHKQGFDNQHLSHLKAWTGGQSRTSTYFHFDILWPRSLVHQHGKEQLNDNKNTRK